jgi:hypothetical protein
MKLNLVDQRQHSNSPQLWVVGCSFAHGLNLPDANTRYGQRVADYLNLPVSFLTAPGSGIDWAHDQLLRSDLTAGDTVIWGLTSINRFSFFEDDQEKFVNARNIGTNSLGMYERVLGKIYTSDSQFHRHIRLIAQIKNILKKLNVKLILLFVEDLSIDVYDDGLKKFLGSDNVVYLSSGNSTVPKHNWPQQQRSYLDFALDNSHPGPLQHQQWADQIIEYLK